jgi:hypothetical protein
MVLSPTLFHLTLSARAVISAETGLIGAISPPDRKHFCFGFARRWTRPVNATNLLHKVAAGIFVLAIAGCSTVKAIVPLSDRSSSKTSVPAALSEPATPDASSGPSAQIQIDYAHADDWLEGVTVREYDGAQLIADKPSANGQRSIVRFEGGTPFWEIEADRGAGTALLSHLGANENRKYALKSVKYGVVPDGFIQTQPDGLLAQPLQTGHYYVFTVHRGSGSTSHQAIHVDGDGAIEGYDAEPMAGTSFSLCCDVSPGFASTAGAGSGQTSDP